MRSLVLSLGLCLALGTANAGEEPRTVTGFVGNKVQTFDTNFKPAGSLDTSKLSGVTSAVKHDSRPFYKIEVDGTEYYVLASKINFADRPRTDMVACNTRKADFQASTFNSTMGSAEKKDCANLQ